MSHTIGEYTNAEVKDLVGDRIELIIALTGLNDSAQLWFNDRIERVIIDVLNDIELAAYEDAGWFPEEPIGKG